MAVALVQEFAIDPDGGGFDDEAGVFRIFDVWETREQAQRFLDEQVMPAVEAVTGGQSDAGPPLRQYFYELHDIQTR